METFKREVREIPAHIRADFTELTSKEKVAS